MPGVDPGFDITTERDEYFDELDRWITINAASPAIDYDYEHEHEFNGMGCLSSSKFMEASRLGMLQAALEA
ncbi:MAG: hypothetical protein JNL58_04085 [Planctomyces sp.]|nr:hypothetical protein [Planctomyces sp.]